MQTIVAIATAHGIGSISIVRVSGKKAYEIALKITQKEKLFSRHATLSYLYDCKKDIIDESIVIYFKSPNSFTGEDIVEFQCHGGIAVANVILQEIIKCGARLANPGEFSKRAFLNGKIDLTKAEAISQIIEAKNQDALKILSKQLKGDLKKFIDELRVELVEILAYAEVNIDYAEEDLPKDIEKSIKNKLDNLSSLIEKSLQTALQKEGLINGFNVSIIGKPNVGKSSLLNKLLNYDRAIVSDIAGTTRDTIEEEIKIGTHLIKIIDTAGVRIAKDSIEEIGVQKSIKSIQESDIVLAIFDNSSPIDEEDMRIIELIKKYQNEKKIFVFLNKSDLANQFDVDKLKDFNPAKITVKNNVNNVINIIKDYLDSQSLDESVMLTTTRQIENMQKALKSIKNAKEPLENGELELFAYEINDAISYISSITFKFDREEILDKMFGSFCLGK